MNDWKCASERGWPERICASEKGRCERQRERCQRLIATHDGVQVGFHGLLVQVDFVEVGGVDDVHVVEACNVLVTSKVTQQPGGARERGGRSARSAYMQLKQLDSLDLPQATLGQYPLAKDIGDLLDGYALARCLVRGSSYAAVGSLP